MTRTIPAPFITTSSIGTVIACSLGSSTTCVVTHCWCRLRQRLGRRHGGRPIGRCRDLTVRARWSTVPVRSRCSTSGASSAFGSSAVSPLPPSVARRCGRPGRTPATPSARTDRRDAMAAAVRPRPARPVRRVRRDRDAIELFDRSVCAWSRRVDERVTTRAGERPVVQPAGSGDGGGTGPSFAHGDSPRSISSATPVIGSHGIGSHGARPPGSWRYRRDRCLLPSMS